MSGVRCVCVSKCVAVPLFSHGPMTIAHSDLEQYSGAVAFLCERCIVMDINLTLRPKPLLQSRNVKDTAANKISLYHSVTKLLGCCRKCQM